MDKIPMTPEGLTRIKEELKRLKTVERPAVIRAIGQAREMGDLSENAEYDSAKERQGFIEARVADMEEKLRRAQVIDVAKLSGKRVQFGATVTLLDLDSDVKKTYQIVGTDETDAAKGRISVASPLARGLIGKGPHDIVEIETPNGPKSYEIVKVRYR